MTSLSNLPQEILLEIVTIISNRHQRSDQCEDDDKDQDRDRVLDDILENNGKSKQDTIVDLNLTNARITLSNLSLTCKILQPLAQTELFRILRLMPNVTTFVHLIETLSLRPELAEQVYTIYFKKRHPHHPDVDSYLKTQGKWVVSPDEASLITGLLRKYDVRSQTNEGYNIVDIGHPISLKLLLAADTHGQTQWLSIEYSDLVVLIIAQCPNIRRLQLVKQCRQLPYLGTPGLVFSNLVALILTPNNDRLGVEIDNSINWLLHASPALRNLHVFMAVDVQVGSQFSHDAINEVTLHQSGLKIACFERIVGAFPNLKEFSYSTDVQASRFIDYNASPRHIIEALIPLQNTLTSVCLNMKFPSHMGTVIWKPESICLTRIKELVSLTELHVCCTGFQDMVPFFESIASPSIELVELWDIDDMSKLGEFVSIAPRILPRLRRLQVWCCKDKLDEDTLLLPDRFSKDGIRLQFIEDSD